jgi:DNA polymerase III epsilon subunit-like protein
MYLVFDTETTGLPRSWRAPASDIHNWPRVVQVAWEAFDETDQMIESHAFIIRPDGFTIPADAERVHGISTAYAQTHGVAIAQALDAFLESLENTQILIGHNISFDLSVIGAELHRVGKGSALQSKTHLCTMRNSTAFCGIPGQYGYKWPTLTELHSKLFDEDVRETHDAVADAATCSKCFFELKRRGIVKIARREPAKVETLLRS